MAERVAAVPTGGFENEFVGDVDKDLFCPICLLPFRDPHLVSCCGAKFCESCIGRVKDAGQPCPMCKQEFTTMLDRRDQRKVLNLKVHCSRHNDGCQWVGELRHADSHEEKECEWAEVKCSYQCGVLVPRRLMAEHQHSECQERPIVKLERMMKKIEQQHIIDLKKMEENLKSESKRLEQEFETKLAIEKERHQSEVCKLKEQHKKELAAVTDELKDDHTTKMADMEKRVCKLEKKVTKVKDLEEESRDTLISSQPIPSYTEFTMTECLYKRRFNIDWKSPPFYSGLRGYKMCLKVYVNGVGDGAGTHVSVFVHLMRGEYDDTLNWPFIGAVTVQLTNRKTDCSSAVVVNFGREAERRSVSDRVRSREIAENGWGWHRFIIHRKVESYIEDCFDSDCLTFRIVKIVVNGL